MRSSLIPRILLVSALSFVGLWAGAASPAEAATYQIPTGLKSVAKTSTTVDLAWTAVKNAPRYRIQMSRAASMSGATYYRVTPNKRQMTGLKPNTKYYFKVRVITAGGANLTSYSPAISVTTGAAGLPLPAPGGLANGEQAGTMASVTWNAVSQAPKYRIQYSKSSNMSSATYVRIAGLRAQLAGLKSSTRYYIKVRVITLDGENLSPYSSAISLTTKSTGSPSLVSPYDLSIKKVSPSSLELGWAAVAGATNYEIERSASKIMSAATKTIVASPKATLAQLSADSTYYVRVRATTASGVVRGNFTQPVQARTSTGSSSQPLKVASYNVKCANCLTPAGSRPVDELPWEGRRSSVVNAIVKQKPDVIGVQEASQGWLKDAAGKSINLSQFEDLRDRLGAAGVDYRLTNSARNNCVKATTPTNCVYKDQGASKDNKIYYNAANVELVSAGAKRLASGCNGCNERYVAWSILQQKVTGKKFFFATTHLEPTKKYEVQRKIQANEAIAEVDARNPDKLPVIFVGDFNSTRYNTPSNAPYDVMIAHGLVDPLGHTYMSPKISSKATAEKRVRANYNSFSGFVRAQRVYGPNENGSNLDYIFTSPMRVSEWETVVNIDPTGKLAGIIPSDHNMISATVILP